MEDSEDIQRLFSHILGKSDLQVDSAVNGLQALVRIKQAQDDSIPYAVILMDMQMPLMDGYTAVHHLRSCGYQGAIIALTVHALDEEKKRCLQVGCDAYITKPIVRSALLEVVYHNAGKTKSDPLDSHCLEQLIANPG
ncbi:MAG: Sensor histidine kinase RcsC [Phycisphaerae bacterium]|nr:Sensor histidine kinase RcsC [Phycisphaerae bacterium]